MNNIMNLVKQHVNTSCIPLILNNHKSNPIKIVYIKINFLLATSIYITVIKFKRWIELSQKFF